MKVIPTVAEFRDVRAATTGSVGLVPTMGFLHEGHISLVRRSRLENDIAVASIFVNPAQFGPNEDLTSYPRDMDSDLAKLEAEGVDLVFAPAVDQVYPDGFSSSIDVGCLAERLEGRHRPGHFRGVATVVCKLLAIVRPDRAYFGQKDAQQCLVVKRLNADLNLGAEIVVCPTVREDDGLALSSRNVYLSPVERKAALVLSRALRKADEMWRDGVTSANDVRSAMRGLIDSEPLAEVDYISIADGDSLQELEQLEGNALASLAVRIGKVRLIDNVVLAEIL